MAKNNWTVRAFRHFQRSSAGGRHWVQRERKNLLGLHPKIGGTPAGGRQKVPFEIGVLFLPLSPAETLMGSLFRRAAFLTCIITLRLILLQLQETSFAAPVALRHV